MNYILIILICIITYLLINSNNEHFTSNFCSSCNTKNIGQCMKCYNCGIYYDSYKQNYKCINGDKDGPHDTTIKTKYWLHNDPFSRYINENKWIIKKPYK